ncbi:MAG: hypothetical protein KatS3mg057_1996 [Herpetosiphonaceae bacterium]|nr:MAG: hypothetical protein KatS3mg057_1996 [Herpetosiphonaceae bacterium]
MHDRRAQRFRTFRRVLERLVEDCDKATMSSEALDTARTFLAEHCTQCGARRSEYLAETSLCMGCYDNPGGIVL